MTHPIPAAAAVGGARNSVAVRLECTNKSLREARLTIGDAVHRFAPTDSRRRWSDSLRPQRPN